MGIFSFLNRDQDYEDIDLTSVIPAEEPGPELPDLCREMPIEILDEGGQVLNTGLITERKGREIAMGRHPGGLSFKICEPGSTVFVRGCDNRMVQFYLRATVVESSRILMRLKDLAPEVRENQRDAFRLAVNAPISICYVNDERFERPEQCTLVDISTGGCCIVSEYLHGEGEVLRLRVKLEDYVAMDFVGEVIRVVDCGKDGFRCGILFAQLKKEEVEALTKMLFNLQLGNRREHSRSETGHW
ncbi:PilZ domain-containing protein [uncultured Oscillibacter sp.]|uniref:PilZ domain-containing protein n=1 Tax=uncultured Oscillibacter sp. TaxID=876091 RepID=UPI0025FF223F|nr:PilZ domain-containing protein [uncultured Oscillibacter sp.]